MSSTEKNYQEYSEKYQSLHFEDIQSAIRRRMVLEQVNKYSPRRILEIGCGTQPLFLSLPHDIDVVTVEPTPTFFQIAQEQSFLLPNTSVYNCRIEDFAIGDGAYDMIVLGCLLHEVNDPIQLLQAVRRHCTFSTIVHVNVPNANSLHRHLAVSMGLIDSIFAISDTQLRMQQRGTIYTMESLATEMTECGFQVIESGSIFIKPFSHQQMKYLIDCGFMTSHLLKGFENLANVLPELGSEIWVNSRLG